MKEIIIKLNKKDIKAIYKAHKYLCDIKSDLLENELGKILFQYEQRMLHHLPPRTRDPAASRPDNRSY